MSERKKRANGIASREAILDAAARIAGERGYEGTGIKAVSELSGLPASSIYWHFKNKDELIAAVIDRSFSSWVAVLDGAFETVDADDPRQAFVESFRNSALQLTRYPDFLRLGLMLLLEHRPDEPTARQRFQAARADALAMLRKRFATTFDGLDDDEVQRAARLTLAAADGLFIAAEAGEADLVEGFGLLAETIYAAASAGATSATTPRNH